MPHHRSQTRRRVTAAGIALLALGAVYGVGFASSGSAAWVVRGSGSSAEVTAGTAVDLSIGSATAATGLYPDGSKAVTFTVHNPNPFPVTIGSATVDSIAVSGGKTPSACTTADIAGLSGAMDPAAAGTTIDAGGDSPAFTVTVSMSAASDDACQGVVATPSVSVQAQAS